MKKRIVLTSLFFLLGLGILFLLKLSSISTQQLQSEILPNIQGVSSNEIVNITSDNSTVDNSTEIGVLLENVTDIENATDIGNSTEVEPVHNVVHYGSNYENGYSSGSSEQITNGGTPMQTSTNSKSQYTNGY